nr:MAG TPA: hypothetical protein [Caudoviricetes sp.]
MSEKIKRKYMAHFINSSKSGSPVYVRLGKDLEEYKIELNANTEKKSNILGETSVNLTSYQVEGAVEPYYAEAGDPLFTRLQDIIDERQTLDDLTTDVIEVHLWDEDNATPGSYVAYKEDAVIEVSSYGGDTTGYQIPFNIHYKGNRVKGKFVLDTKTFTAG